MNKYVSYADLQNAYGRIQASIGIDPLPENVESTDIEILAEALEERENNWQSTFN